MTGPRGDIAPEWGGLGKKVEPAKPQPAAPKPAQGIDPGKHIVVDQNGRLSTNDPRNNAAMLGESDWAVLLLANGDFRVVYPD